MRPMIHLASRRSRVPRRIVAAPSAAHRQLLDAATEVVEAAEAEGRRESRRCRRLEKAALAGQQVRQCGQVEAAAGTAQLFRDEPQHERSGEAEQG